MEDISTREALPAAETRARTSRGTGWIFAITAAVVLADQLTKWLIRETVDRGEAWPGDWLVKIVHITNSGAAFGMLQGAGPLLAVTSVIGGAAILVYLFNPSFAHPLMRVGLALMLGGAIGNLIDRLVKGEVVDFIKFPNFPAFNVADSAITIGVVLLLWTMLRETGESPGQPAS